MKTLVLLLFLAAGCSAGKSVVVDPSLPQPDFDIHAVQSDPGRPVVEFKRGYKGRLIDTHVHLDPPQQGKIESESLKSFLNTLDQARTHKAIFMPVPNEGHMRGRSNGAGYRKELNEMGGSKVALFCGSEYITNWLHDSYHNGLDDKEFESVLKKLSQDLDDPQCIGIGEIGLFHFNKTGHQNIIQYPPTFEPFLKIVELVVKKGKWLDLHAEPIDPDGKSYQEFVFGGMALLYQKFPSLKLIISHTAMTNTTNARRILQTYPNVMMNFKPIKKHNLWRNLEPITNSRGRLYKDWAELFEEMPNRFMVGSDAKFGRMGKGVLAEKGMKVEKYERLLKQIRRILGSLNAEAAEQIAYQNAERILR